MIRDALSEIQNIRRTTLIEKANEHINNFKEQAKQLNKKISVKSDNITLELIEVLRLEFNIALIYNPDTDCFEQFIPLEKIEHSTIVENPKETTSNEHTEYPNSFYSFLQY